MLCKIIYKPIISLITSLTIVLLSSFQEPINPIPKTMANIVRDIYAKGIADRFQNINQHDILAYLDASSLHILAHEYWTFDVNTEVDVFVCRDIQQKEVPFWLLKDSFQQTKELISNENVTYEVWRKRFKKGKVNLGINGFDRHRYVYFVAIKATNKSIELAIKPIWPLDQVVEPLHVGSVIYKDWDELTVNQFTPALEGAYILPTYRGRSREAHLIKAFRQTDYPSSSVPDQLLLSWIDDPQTSQHISWRTRNDLASSSFIYWREGTLDTLQAMVEVQEIHDVMLVNDPIVNRLSVSLTGLEPNTKYNYQLISNAIKSKVYSFTTAPKSNDFEFGWFGDMHNDPSLGLFIPRWKKMFPNANFYLQAGDLVNTGLYRDHWDILWNATKSITDEKPFMSVPGNHDSQEALFPWMYLSYLKFPANGPSQLPKGLSYTFDYGNTLFLMVDAVTFSAKEQEAWIRDVLSSSTKRFKIVFFHFAPHTFESSYADIIQYWQPLFVKYDVDLICNGHFHYYHKTTNPSLPRYIMSVATKRKGEDIEGDDEAYIVQKGYLYQHVKISDSSLELCSVDSLGLVIDQFKINKN